MFRASFTYVIRKMDHGRAEKYAFHLTAPATGFAHVSGTGHNFGGPAKLSQAGRWQDELSPVHFEDGM